MKALNDVRKSLLSAFQSFHEANYPELKVNYPNLVVVDIEHQLDPFISLEIHFDNLDQATLHDDELEITGRFVVYYYFRFGKGTQGALEYTDALNQQFCQRIVGELWLRPARPYNISTFPGWSGVLNSIPFIYTN